jgi:hypothetical protein
MQSVSVFLCLLVVCAVGLASSSVHGEVAFSRAHLRSVSVSSPAACRDACQAALTACQAKKGFMGFGAGKNCQPTWAACVAKCPAAAAPAGAPAAPAPKAKAQACVLPVGNSYTGNKATCTAARCMDKKGSFPSFPVKAGTPACPAGQGCCPVLGHVDSDKRAARLSNLRLAKQQKEGDPAKYAAQAKSQAAKAKIANSDLRAKRLAAVKVKKSAISADKGACNQKCNDDVKSGRVKANSQQDLDCQSFCRNRKAVAKENKENAYDYSAAAGAARDAASAKLAADYKAHTAAFNAQQAAEAAKAAKRW